MALTIDRLLAQIRRERELRTGAREQVDQSDLLTRLTPRRPEDEGGEFPFPDPSGGSGGGRTLTFAQTAAGARLQASLARETERFAGAERLKLEETLHGLAMELLPPGDVETAMKQARRGEVVRSKLAYQAVLQNLSDATANAERRADLALEEENEKRTLREARSRIVIDMIGRDLGAAILFALGAGGGE